MLTKQAFNSRAFLLFNLLLVIFILPSCDPGKTLQIKSVNKPNYSVIVYANRSILHSRGGQNEKFILQIPTNDTIPKYDTAFSYGIGGWSDPEITQQLAKNIDSIIITSNSVTLRLANQNDIAPYLIKQIHGWGGSVLTIEAK